MPLETLEETTTRLRQFVADYTSQPSVNIRVDLAPGSVLDELLIKLSAQLHSALQTTVQNITSASSVADVLSSQEDTVSAAIDRVASNFNVVRDMGKPVLGKIKVIVAFPRTYIVDAGFQLVHPGLGLTFSAVRTFQVSSTFEDNETLGELKLYSENVDGPYYFLLPVQNTAATTPVAIPHNSSLVLNAENTTLEGFVEARAFGNFSVGQAIETDRQLIQRFQTGLSVKGLMSPASLQALLPMAFPDIFNSAAGAVLSVVGANDVELNRGRHALLGIPSFGLADVYIRTSKAVQLSAYTATAKCISVDGPPVWQVVLDSSVSNFPAWFYELVSVSYTDSAGYVKMGHSLAPPVFSASTPTSVTLTGSNDVSSSEVARFTKYQRCTFTMRMPGVTSPSVNDLRPVQVMVTYLPYIGEVQDYLLQSAHRLLGVDYLVKAVVPCNLTVDLKLTRRLSGPVEVEQIKKEIYEEINSLRFGDPVVVSRLVNICHDYNVAKVHLPVLVQGSIVLPSTTAGQVRNIVANNVLRIPFEDDLLKYGVSTKTTAFFINFSDKDQNSGITVTVN